MFYWIYDYYLFIYLFILGITCRYLYICLETSCSFCLKYFQRCMGGWFYMVLFLAEEGPQKTQSPQDPPQVKIHFTIDSCLNKEEESSRIRRAITTFSPKLLCGCSHPSHGWIDCQRHNHRFCTFWNHACIRLHSPPWNSRRAKGCVSQIKTDDSVEQLNVLPGTTSNTTAFLLYICDLQ